MPDRSFIEWDKDDIDALGILKVDILALGMLTCIRKCFDLIAAHYGQHWDLASVPQEDPRVYNMLCKGDSIGVFQVESRAQINMLPRLRPRTFYDLVIEVAIVRPGPIQGDMVHPYLRRRSGEEPISYPAPAAPHDPQELKKILGRTLGVPIFQEQAMKIAIDAAKFSSKEANELRKAMAFCAALLNSQPMGFYAPAQLVRDAQEHGVEVRPRPTAGAVGGQGAARCARSATVSGGA